MAHEAATYTSIFQMVLTAEDPVKALMELAVSFLEKKDIESLQYIDAMLNGRFISAVRSGKAEDINACLYALLAFIDSSKGDILKSMENGDRLFYRWDHLTDLCNVALEDYHPRQTVQFIASRKHGEELMKILHLKPDGVRFKDLAAQLWISQQHLAKLLREFETEELVARERTGKTTIVRLGFMGRAYMADREPVPPANKKQTTGETTTVSLPAPFAAAGAAASNREALEPEWGMGEVDDLEHEPDQESRNRVHGMSLLFRPSAGLMPGYLRKEAA